MYWFHPKFIHSGTTTPVHYFIQGQRQYHLTQKYQRVVVYSWLPLVLYSINSKIVINITKAQNRNCRFKGTIHMDLKIILLLLEGQDLDQVSLFFLDIIHGTIGFVRRFDYTYIPDSLVFHGKTWIHSFLDYF